MRRTALAAAALVAVLTAPRAAHAFCGFYINGAGSEMFNDATQVVLMRKGTRTVLSMQNNYKGPPEAFAMVIPVPTVLQEADVKTLPKEVFQRVDTMGAPRLVEYWEQDPCGRDWEEFDRPRRKMAPRVAAGAMRDESTADLGVTIEAKFEVGEYQIVILSARDSTGLDTWLRQENYQIPKGAEPFLRPYVESGLKFFVAKVDPKKVRFTRRSRRPLAPALPLRQRRVQPADPARAGQLERDARSDRVDPGAQSALRGRELQERHDPDQTSTCATRCGPRSARSTRRCSTGRSPRTPARW
jgi:hypothetical protein